MCIRDSAKRVMTCKFALAKSEIAAAPDSPAAKRAAAKEYPVSYTHLDVYKRQKSPCLA